MEAVLDKVSAVRRCHQAAEAFRSEQSFTTLLQFGIDCGQRALASAAAAGHESFPPTAIICQHDHAQLTALDSGAGDLWNDVRFRREVAAQMKIYCKENVVEMIALIMDSYQTYVSASDLAPHGLTIDDLDSMAPERRRQLFPPIEALIVYGETRNTMQWRFQPYRLENHQLVLFDVKPPLCEALVFESFWTGMVYQPKASA